MAKDRTNPLTADSVERILAKMKPYTDAGRLSQIDQNVLLQEIQWCARNYSARKGIRLTEKNLTKLARLKKLLRDLRNDPATPWLLLGEDIEEVLKSEKVIEGLSSVLARKPIQPLWANPVELLVGQELPLVFKRVFGLPAGRSRSSNRKLRAGPYLVFARAVLTEMSINYSDESISRTLSVRGRRRDR